MTLINLFELENPNEEQQIVLDMINTQSQYIACECLSDNALEVLESKGYSVDFMYGEYQISTDYDSTKINVDHLVNLTDELECKNIPNAARVRNYIISAELNSMADLLIETKTALIALPNVNVLKEYVSNYDLFCAALTNMNAEITKEFKNYYRVEKA